MVNKMAYSSKGGRPMEYASKSSHGNIIKNEFVIKFLKECKMPKTAQDLKNKDFNFIEIDKIEKNPIRNIIAIDGGYNEVPVKNRFPSTKITFFQFGSLIFKTSDLDKISEEPFIDPKDISKLKKIDRFEFILPTRNILFGKTDNLTDSVRLAIYEFFIKDIEDDNLMETLKWFIYEEYGKNHPERNLPSCPKCNARDIKLIKSQMSENYTFLCPNCQNVLYLTDIFTLHNAVDNEIGIRETGSITLLLEQMLLVHLIRIILENNPELLKDTLFIKDGPLAYFGNTSKMYTPMRALINYLFKNYDLHLVGLEKSGSFVEHANEIFGLIPNGNILMPNNEYIYNYIIPGRADNKYPYGMTTYYGNKIIFKTWNGRIYVATIPTIEGDVLSNPNINDFQNLDIILFNIEKLKCDMYENALFPVALVNQLVSLSDHPSSQILQKFAKKKIKE